MKTLVSLTALLTLTTLGACDFSAPAPTGQQRPSTPAPSTGSQATGHGEASNAQRPAIQTGALESVCDPNAFACADGNTLEYCGRAGTMRSSCDSVCASAGYSSSLGCGFDYGFDGDTCFCAAAPAPPAPSCQLGWSCSGDYTLSYCDGGSNQTWDCDSVCRQEGFSQSEGCFYDASLRGDSCYCSDALSCLPGELTCGDGSCLSSEFVCDGYVDCPGSDDEIGCATECTPGESWCTGALTVETCNEQGLWVDWHCDDVCQSSGYAYAQGCSYDAYSDGDACFCN